VQQARGDVADQEKLGEVRVADAERERMVQVANATKLRDIGVREAAREQAVRIAELEKEQGIGEQTAAYEREAQIKDAEQRKRIAVATAESKAIAGEAESQAAIIATRAQLALREAEAFQLAETKKREAEAKVLESQNRAMTLAALAQAERVEAERRAALEAPAKAEKAKTIVEAEAEAERVKINANAEAAAIYARLEAEARGQYEILAKKADALRQMVDAAGGAQHAYQLLMLEHLDTLAETASKAISNIKFDKVVVWEGGGQPHGATAGFIQNMGKMMPPMMQVLRDIGGVELPSYMGTIKAEADGGGKEIVPAEGYKAPSPKEPTSKR